MSDHPLPTTTLADLGEQGLLALMLPRLPSSSGTLVGPGDDAAVVRTPDSRVVATTDMLVQGTDFRLDWSSASDVGWKAAAQNLADVAAMGAVATSLLVALVAPPDLPAGWVLGLMDGVVEACSGTGAAVVGGDLSSGPLVVVAVTALGDLEGREPVLRSGARAGDVVAVAGSLGRSAAGLELLRRCSPAAPELVATHRRPTPACSAGVRAAREGATAMLDVSDGLVRDVGRMARASGLVALIDFASLRPFGAQLEAAARLIDPHQDLTREWLLTGGEDHAMLATFPPQAPLPTGFVQIGTLRAAVVEDEAGLVRVDGSPATSFGWDHFRPRA